MEVVIKQTNSRFIYGYEYLGNPERMVITPHSFQEQCRRSALYAAQRLGWTVIGCSDGENPRSIEEISDEIWGAVRGSLI